MWYFVFSEILSPVGNVEAGQVVGSIAEEVQQGVARLRHHLRDGLVPISLRNNQTATIITQKKSLRCFYYHLYSSVLQAGHIFEALPESRQKGRIDGVAVVHVEVVPAAFSSKVVEP